MQILFLPEIWAIILSAIIFLGVFLEHSNSKVAYLFNIIYIRQKNKLESSKYISEEIEYILLFNEIGITNQGLYSNALFILTYSNIYIFKVSLFGKVTYEQYKYEDIKRFKYKEGILGNNIRLSATSNKDIYLVYDEVGDFEGAIKFLDKKINNKDILTFQNKKDNFNVGIRFCRAFISLLRTTVLLPFIYLRFYLTNLYILGALGAVFTMLITIMPDGIRNSLWEFIVNIYSPFMLIIGAIIGE